VRSTSINILGLCSLGEVDIVLEDAAAGKARVLTPEEETARKLAFVKVSRLPVLRSER
jgi:hypothetical protein